ncbi:unnamed protein product [Arabidopsis halleri]
MLFQKRNSKPLQAKTVSDIYLDIRYVSFHTLDISGTLGDDSKSKIKTRLLR